MIGTLRKQARQGNLKFLLWITICALAGSSILYIVQTTRQARGGTDIATVNGLGIPVLDFVRKLRNTEAQLQHYKQLYGPLIVRYILKDQSPDQHVLDTAITEKALESATSRMGMQVSADYVASKLKDQLFIRQVLGDIIHPQFIQNGALNISILKTYLKHAGISEEQFEEEVKQAITRHTLLELAQESAYVPQQALKDRYERLFAKRKYYILTLPFEQYQKKAQAEQLPEQALTSYFEAHKEQYRIPEKRSGILWTFTPDHYGIVLTDGDRQDYYTQHKNEFIAQPEEAQLSSVTVQDKTKAQELYKELSTAQNTAQFTALAKKHNLPVSTRTLTRTGKQPALEEAVFVGNQQQVTSPVHTDKGYEISYIVSKKAPVYKSFDQVKDEINKKLMQEKFKQAFLADGQRIISQAQDAPDILARFITDKKAQESSLQESSASTNIHAQKLFGIEQENNYVFYYHTNKGFISKLTNITESSLPELTQVKDKVTKDLKETRAQELLKQDLEKLKAADSLEKAAQELKAQIQSTTEKTDWLAPDSQDALKKLKDKKIPTDKLFTLTFIDSKAQAITPEGGFMFQLIEKEPFNEQAFNQKQDTLRKQLEYETQSSIMQSFKEQLRDKACVKINTELLQQVVRR